jgi:RNA polymerase sigma factor (TIGR02999 family)
MCLTINKRKFLGQGIMSPKQSVTTPGDDPFITKHLQNWRDGDADSAGEVFARLHAELRRMAAHVLSSERPGHTLQPTALIHELYMRLDVGNSPDWRSRTHFFAVAAKTLRRILIDYARARSAVRRGGDDPKVPLDVTREPGETCSLEDLLTIDQALTKLEQADERAARVTELRFFGGLSESEIAKELEVSEITVKRDWKFARAWLAVHLRGSRL